MTTKLTPYLFIFIGLTILFTLISSPLPVQAGDPGKAAAIDRTHRIVVSDGTELHVTVRGQGLPCLYIHGGPGVGSYWMEELYGDVLEKYFTMIYLDQRGSGRSGSAAGGDYSPERMALDIEEVKAQLGIGDWYTLSHSFGGLLQVKHAELYPDELLGMIMIAATLNLNESIRSTIHHALNFLEIPADQRSPYLDEEAYPLDRLMPLFGQMREKGIFWKIHYADPLNYQRMDSVMGQLENPNYEFSGSALGMSSYYENFKPLTEKLNHPVLFFYGTRDYAVGVDHYKGVLFPGLALHAWEGGHVPFMEGKKELEEAIAGWLGTL